jgi:hypothetical protein
MAKTKNNGETEYHVWLWDDNMDHLDAMAAQLRTKRSHALNLIIKEHRDRVTSPQTTADRKI